MIDKFIAHNTFPRNYVPIPCEGSKEELSMNPETVRDFIKKLQVDHEQAMKEKDKLYGQIIFDAIVSPNCATCSNQIESKHCDNGIICVGKVMTRTFVDFSRAKFEQAVREKDEEIDAKDVIIMGLDLACDQKDEQIATLKPADPKAIKSIDPVVRCLRQAEETIATTKPETWPDISPDQLQAETARIMNCTKCGKENHVNDFATPDVCMSCFEDREDRPGGEE